MLFFFHRKREAIASHTRRNERGRGQRGNNRWQFFFISWTAKQNGNHPLVTSPTTISFTQTFLFTIVIIFSKWTYFLVRALRMLSCDLRSSLTPRYSSLSNRPGLKSAGSRRSGRFVAPMTNTSHALWSPSSSASSCDTTLNRIPKHWKN